MENKISAEGKVKLCPHCKQEVDPQASRCPHCQGKIYLWTKRRKAMAWIIGLGIIGLLSGASSETSTPASTEVEASPVTTTTSSPVKARVPIGNNGYLRIAGEGDITVLRTKDDLDAYIKAAVSKDTYGMAEMILNGDGFFVANGTKVLVIGGTPFTKQVRILEGEKLGSSGWVPSEFVSAN